jgi:hypothetical protein
MPVQEKIDHEQYSVDDHIQGSEADRNDLINPVAEALERIHAEESPFEETDGDTGQGHTDHRHYNSAYLFAVHIPHSFRSFLACRCIRKRGGTGEYKKPGRKARLTVMN